MFKTCALTLVSALLMAGASQAGIITAFTNLSAANEIPTNPSTATGMATVTVDTVLNTMRVQVTYSGLTSTVTGAHIHCCVPQPANTNVATAIPVFPGFPTTTSGTYDQILDLTLASNYNPTFIGAGTVAQAEAALINGIATGQTYLNIHTQTNGGGEIRGVLAAVPEPGTTTLMTAGLGLILLAWRRRRV